MRLKSYQFFYFRLQVSNLAARMYDNESYMQDESPEGGRFKKEIVIDATSYLLFIPDEGGPPELQVGVLRLIQMYF